MILTKRGPVDADPGGLEFPFQSSLPASAGIESNTNNPIRVRWPFDPFLMEESDLGTPTRSEEKSQLQDKRYKGTVGVSAARDLHGTVRNEGASKGILVTTSGYGSASFEFANGKPLELLAGSNLLFLLAEHAGIEARIEPPEDWVDPAGAEIVEHISSVGRLRQGHPDVALAALVGPNDLDAPVHRQALAIQFLPSERSKLRSA